MKAKLLMAAIVFAVSLGFASSRIARADGCDSYRCSPRTDANLWCCNLKYELVNPNACVYFNDTSGCSCATCGALPSGSDS